MPKPDPADDRSTMDLIDAVKSLIYLTMAATDKLTVLFNALVLRRRRELRDQRPRPPQ